MESRDRRQSELVSRGYDAGASSYAKSWTKPHPWMDEERAQFRARVSPGMALLDVGCGPGHDSDFWARAGLSTLGIDISKEAISTAHGLYPNLAFKTLDIFDAETLGRTFDAVWMSYSLLHITRASAPEAIGIVARLLKDRGLFFVQTSLAASSQETVRTIAGLKDEQGQEIEVPYTIWSEEDLTCLFKKEFSIEWSRSYEPLPGRPQVWSGVMRRNS